MFKRRTGPKQFTSWHAGLLGVMLVAALLIGVVRWATGNETPPTSDVPAVTFDDVRDVVEEEPAPEADPIVADPVVEDPVIEEPAVAPTSFNLALPFTSQAPTGNWDAVHEETCEEASFLMIVEYFSGTPAGKLDATTSDNAMLDLVAYEEAHGYGVSITAAEAATIIEDYYEGAYKAEIVDDPTVEQIKQLIADGYPVIVPAAGRELGNPFFTGEGPLYHMLVIRGYDDGYFITNDPGTRHGENYTYSVDVLMSAMGDWNDGSPQTGASRVIIMRPVVE